MLLDAQRFSHHQQVSERDSSLQVDPFLSFIADKTGAQQSLNGETCAEIPQPKASTFTSCSVFVTSVSSQELRTFNVPPRLECC